MRYATTALVLALALAVSGCITTLEEHQRLKSRVSGIERQQREMNEKWDKRLRRMETRLDKTVSELRATIENSTSPVQSTQANLWSEVRNLRQETAKIKGELQSQTKKLERTNGTQRLEEMESELGDLRNRLETMSSRLGLESFDTEQNGSSSDSSEGGKSEAKAPEEIPAEDLYQRALESFKEREYQRAVTLWSLYIKKKPDGDLVPNAYFWQGEAHYQMQDYSEAALQYQKVVEDYPDSNKHAPAMLKLGLSFLRLDKKKPGRIMLQRVVNNYQGSRSAERAQRQLDKL